jgi:hypothetical protein
LIQCGFGDQLVCSIRFVFLCRFGFLFVEGHDPSFYVWHELKKKLTHSHSQKINCNFSVSLYPQREMEMPHRNNTKNPFIELYESFFIMSKKANVETAKSWTSLFFKVCRHIPLNNCLMVWSRVWEAKKMKKIGQVYCVSKK